MAINPVPVQAVFKTSTTQSISIASGDGWSTPSTGNLIVLMCSFRVDSVTTNAPNFAAQGYTVAQSHYDGNAVRRGAIAWKVSDGTESTIAIDAHSTDIFNNWAMIAAEFESTDLDLSAVEASNELVQSSFATPAASGAVTTAGGALCIAILAAATHNPWDNGTSPTVDNSYTKRAQQSSVNSNVGLWYATKAASTGGDQAAAWSTTDTGIGAYVAVITFAESAASANIPEFMHHRRQQGIS